MKGSIAFVLTFVAAMSMSAGNVDGFEKGWRFIQQDVTLEQTVHTEGWRTVDLPHDWSIEGEFSRENPTGQGGWLPAGIGWYVKEFDYEPEGHSVGGKCLAVAPAHSQGTGCQCNQMGAQCNQMGAQCSGPDAARFVRQFGISGDGRVVRYVGSREAPCGEGLQSGFQ